MILTALTCPDGDDAVGLAIYLLLTGRENVLTGGLVPVDLEEESIGGRAYRYSLLSREGIPTRMRKHTEELY